MLCNMYNKHWTKFFLQKLDLNDPKFPTGMCFVAQSKFFWGDLLASGEE